LGNDPKPSAARPSVLACVDLCCAWLRRTIPHRCDTAALAPVSRLTAASKDLSRLADPTALGALVRLAQHRDVAVVIVAHNNERSDVWNTKDKISGHKILTNTVRSIRYVARLDNGTDVAVEHAKQNSSRRATTLTYRIDPDTGEFAWIGTSTVNANELVQHREPSKTQKARAWLREIVPIEGRMDRNEIVELGLSIPCFRGGIIYRRCHDGDTTTVRSGVPRGCGADRP
jgi:hypothetical protein